MQKVKKLCVLAINIPSIVVSSYNANETQIRLGCKKEDEEEKSLLGIT